MVAGGSGCLHADVVVYGIWEAWMGIGGHVTKGQTDALQGGKDPGWAQPEVRFPHLNVIPRVDRISTCTEQGRREGNACFGPWRVGEAGKESRQSMTQ